MAHACVQPTEDKKPATGFCSRKLLRSAIAVRAKSELVGTRHQVGFVVGGVQRAANQGGECRLVVAADGDLGLGGVVGLWGCKYVARAHASRRHQPRARRRRF